MVYGSYMRGMGEGEEYMAERLIYLAKALRKDATHTEQLLWRHLRAKQIGDCKFRRQEPFDEYIADFVCYETRLIIEVDGGQHSEGKKRDEKRDEWFKNQGFTVLRFWNNEVLANIDGVLEMIREHMAKSPSPNPPIEGGETEKFPLPWRERVRVRGVEGIVK